MFNTTKSLILFQGLLNLLKDDFNFDDLLVFFNNAVIEILKLIDQEVFFNYTNTL